MFDFKEKFKDRPTIELLQMLERPEKYRPDAITAANEIIAFRKNENLAEWENNLAALQLAKEDARNKIVSKQANEKNNIWIENEKEIKDKRIARNQIFCIGLVLAIVSALSLYYSLSFFFYNGLPKAEDIFDFYTLATIGPPVFALISLIFFYKKEKTGWIILTAIFTYHLAFRITMLFNGIRMISMSYNDFFSPVMLLMPMIQVALFSIILYQMNSERIRSVYLTTRKQFTITVLITAFLYGCLVFGIHSGS